MHALDLPYLDLNMNLIYSQFIGYFDIMMTDLSVILGVCFPSTSTTAKECQLALSMVTCSN